jgi:hypothetical protein
MEQPVSSGNISSCETETHATCRSHENVLCQIHRSLYSSYAVLSALWPIRPHPGTLRCRLGRAATTPSLMFRGRIARRKPDLDPCSHRKRIHRSASSPRKTRSSASTSTSRYTITRRPFALTTSIRPAVGNEPAAGSISGASSAGTKPPTGDAASSCHARASRLAGGHR